MRTVTITEVSKAIRKNGLSKRKGSYGSAYIGYACAIGQAGINLKVEPIELHDSLNKIQIHNFKPVLLEDGYGIGTSSALGDAITRLNDHSNMTFQEIADWLDNWIESNQDYSIQIYNNTTDNRFNLVATPVT